VESEPSPEDYAFGVDLYNHGYFWEAHEAWEGLWREADDPARRAFLQGLILCAAAALKAREDRWDAAASLAERALDRMATAGGPCMGLDGPAFASRVVAFVARREGGPPPIELTGR
jgi:predicted metal-dependent hydrolase